MIDQGTPLYLYREIDGSAIYLFNAAVNRSIFVRTWFNDSALEKQAEVVYSSGDVRVYKVNKEIINN